MKWIVPVLLFCKAFMLPVLGQKKSVVLAEASPETAGVSTERLARLDRFIQRYIDDRELNGATALILRDGKIVYHKAFGYSDLENRKPMRKDDIFRIASMTKPIVSVAAMMLVEEGLMSLDDPVSKYIPEFKETGVLEKYNAADTTYVIGKPRSQVTVRHLLNQTSGIGYAQIGSPEANAIYAKNRINGGIGTPYSTLKETIPRLARLPLFHQPGEKYLYGLNTDVLGYLIEVVSGKNLDRFLAERIFVPLGMKDTHFYLPAGKKDRLVQLYKQGPDGKVVLQEPVTGLNGEFQRDFPLAANGTYYSGGAGLSSTALDYGIFCQMLLNGGIYNGVRILSPHTIRVMTSNQIGKSPMWNGSDGPNRFGLGFGVYTSASESQSPAQAGTFDWAGMFATHFWVDPKSRMSCVFMRNIWPTTNWDFGDKVKSVVYQALTD